MDMERGPFACWYEGQTSDQPPYPPTQLHRLTLTKTELLKVIEHLPEESTIEISDEDVDSDIPNTQRTYTEITIKIMVDSQGQKRKEVR
jgi:hypothetical protein